MQLALLATLFMSLAEAGIRHKRITCGRRAQPNEIPWQVQVRFSLDNETYDTCGGSLYNNNTVITAAHCVRIAAVLNKFKHRNRAKVTHWIRAGSLSRTDTTAPWIQADEVVIHPNFSLLHFRLAGDIALLRLQSDVAITPASKPIPLLGNPAPRNSFKYCKVSGWGMKHNSIERIQKWKPQNYLNSLADNGDTPDLLLMSYVYPEFNATICQSLYRSEYPNGPAVAATLIEDIQLCSGFMGCSGSCGGDSGGPLACLRKGSEQYELTGVVSWGGLCGSAAPGVYTSIPHFKPWIEECTAALDRGSETDNCTFLGNE